MTSKTFIRLISPKLSPLTTKNFDNLRIGLVQQNKRSTVISKHFLFVFVTFLFGQLNQDFITDMFECLLRIMKYTSLIDLHFYSKIASDIEKIIRKVSDIDNVK